MAGKNVVQPRAKRAVQLADDKRAFSRFLDRVMQAGALELPGRWVPIDVRRLDNVAWYTVQHWDLALNREWCELERR